jgi:uncharacterized protein (DUF58 family)
MDRQDVQHLVWWAKDRVRGFMTGLHRSPDFGFSLDFAQHRAYVPGDAPKFIDWSVLARQDKVLTKQYEAESNLRAYFVLDSSSSMSVEYEGKSKWGYAVEMFALLATILQKQRDAMGLMEVCQDGHRYFEAKNTSEQIASMLAHIQGTSSTKHGNADFGAAFDELLSRVPARSQIIVFLDAFETRLEELEQNLSRAVNSKHQLMVVAFDHPKEHEARHLQGREVVDAETGERMFFTKELQASYAEFQLRQINAMEALTGKVGGKFYKMNVEDDVLVSLSKLVGA